MFMVANSRLDAVLTWGCHPTLQIPNPSRLHVSTHPLGLYLLEARLRDNHFKSLLFLTSLPFSYTPICFCIIHKEMCHKRILLSKAAKKPGWTSSVWVHISLLLYGSRCSFFILPTRWMEREWSMGGFTNASSSHLFLLWRCLQVLKSDLLIFLSCHGSDYRVSGWTWGLSTVKTKTMRKYVFLTLCRKSCPMHTRMQYFLIRQLFKSSIQGWAWVTVGKDACHLLK